MSQGNRFPRISIVTASLNQGRFIEDCLRSVADQGYPDVEHIVVDGGSTDETAAILEAWRDRLTHVVIEPDDGAADAINKGLALCTGDVVAWLNADDFYLPGALEKVAEAWRAAPNAGFWFGNGQRAAEDGTLVERFCPYPITYARDALVFGLNYVLQPSTFMNGALMREIGGLDTTLRYGFDWELWLRLADRAEPAAIEADLSASREYGDTLTATGSFARAEELRRIAERFSGQALTPGALCYYLHTVLREAQRPGTALPPELSSQVVDLWKAVQRSLSAYGADVAGMVRPKRVPGSYTVVVDLFPLIAGVSGGIVPWVRGVLESYLEDFPLDRVVFCHRRSNLPFRLDGRSVEYVALSDDPNEFYAGMTELLQREQADVCLRTYPQETGPNFPYARQIFVVPDIQHEFFPEFFEDWALASRRRAFAMALAGGGAVATLTEHSRKTLEEDAYNASPDIFEMPAALPRQLAVQDESGVSRTALGPEVSKFERYFFMPANMWPHKNHRRLFEAFRKALPKLPKGTGLVLTGNPEGWEKMVQGFGDLPIVHLGFVDHDRLRALFRHAEALVYFSLFEGFGMPLLEAFHYGIPVLCSDGTSLPEVGGDACLSCDPTDTDAMAALMVRIVETPGLRDELAQRAAGRLDAYDWGRSAAALHAAIDRLIARVAEGWKPPRHQPLVSIVMPTRNQGQFIRRSIDSVLAQTYPNVELLVMDGCSTDDTVEILKSYGDRVRWISEPDKGQTDAINKGLAQTKGSIQAYLNSDDILLPDALEKVVEFFNDNPEVDMVYGNADYIDADDRVIGTYATAYYSFGRLMEDCCVCQPAAFWRKRIADRIGPFDASLQTAMDYDYWLRIGASGGIIRFVEDKLAQSRLHEDAKTLVMREKIYEEIFQICRTHGGYVSLSYINGLWAHRVYEKAWWGPRLRRLMPRLYRLPALVHYATMNGSNKAALGVLARQVFYYWRNRAPRSAERAKRLFIRLRARFS